MERLLVVCDPLHARQLDYEAPLAQSPEDWGGGIEVVVVGVEGV